MAGILSKNCLGKRMSDLLEDRLTELETRLAFLDDLVGSLNDTVAAHDRQLHALHNTVERLHHELIAARSALSHVRDASDETPPPHY